MSCFKETEPLLVFNHMILICVLKGQMIKSLLKRTIPLLAFDFCAISQDAVITKGGHNSSLPLSKEEFVTHCLVSWSALVSFASALGQSALPHAHS